MNNSRRREMDSFDALILHHRGMNIAQMAEYDGCTQTAALQALLPHLLGQRSPYAAWWEHQPGRIDSNLVAEMTGCDKRFVHRAMKAS